MSDRFTRIIQLPEKNELFVTDYLAVENTEDTWKVPFSAFTNYINSLVQNKVDSDISNTMDQKISEIQMQISSVDDMIRDLNEKQISFDQAEERRNQLEKDIAQNEAIRQSTYDETRKMIDQWVDDENDRKKFHEELLKDWSDMNDVWDQWSDAEKQRVINEDERKRAELNRASAESEREKRADEMFRNGEIAQENESKRVESFNNMTNYFSNIKSCLDNYVYEGTSDVAENQVIDILQIVLPAVNHGYEALLHLKYGNGYHTFIALNLLFEYSRDSIVSGDTTIIIPKKYKNIIDAANNLRAGYRLVDNTVEVILQYKCPAAGSIKTAIIWDNITTYKPDNSGIYAKALKEQIPQASFSTIRQLISITDSINSIDNAPQGFVDILDSLETQIGEMIDEIKPFKMWPVGSIYMTTSTANPKDLLGGGVWVALYGGNGISEGLSMEDGSILRSPQIYYWERTA